MSFPEAEPELPPALYWAARLEDRVQVAVNRWLRARGWTTRVLPYTGYGTGDWARVLARVVLAPPGTSQAEVAGPRGWRRFFAATAADVALTVTVGGRRHEVRSERGGYVDTVLDADLPPGWAAATVVADGAPAGSPAVRLPIRVVGAEPGWGLVSDIDDTVVVTALPRPLVAFWNTFVRRETSRRPVRGMTDLYAGVAAEHPDLFVVYLSTGAWNVAPALAGFLARFGFPAGPLLLTDWGPTTQAMFRSGPQHKRDQLARLLSELPQLQWLFVGDDGQLDPTLYGEAAAAAAPGRVRAIGIRQLSVGQQVRTHGLADPRPEERRPSPDVAGSPPGPEVRAPDGFGLLRALRAAGILAPGTGEPRADATRLDPLRLHRSRATRPPVGRRSTGRA